MRTTPLLTLAQAQSILDDGRMSDILEPLLGSMHWWRTEMKHSHLMLSNSTKARALHDYWWHHTETRLNEKLVAYFCVEHNQRLLILDDKAMIRIKLLDDNLESRNLSTIQAEELVHQVHQIPMLPPLDALPAGLSTRSASWLVSGGRLHYLP